MPAKYVKVAEIDPKIIQENLTAFLRSYPQFADYNFDAGTLGIILSLLAQNTYYGALYDNFAFNEAFLDSAQLRDSIVSKAKHVGFVPRSAKSAKMKISLEVIPDDSPSSIIMARGTRFRTTFNSQSLFFVTTEEIAMINSGDGTFIATDVELAEGYVLTHRFTYDSADAASFTLPNQNVDTDSLVVYVQSTSSSTDRTEYTLATDLSEVSDESTVYYLEEDVDGKFRVYFGDGVLGKALDNGNYVTIEYRVTVAETGNDIGRVVLVDTVGGYTDVTVTVTERAAGGQSIQTAESVRFHAPRFYEMQNRVVTESDYIEHVLNQNSFVEAISVWGGEENVPPLYGKTVISIKPYTGYRLTNQKKLDIIASLRKLNIMAIDPVLVDPSFVYITPTLDVTFDSSMTTLAASAMYAKIAQAIIDYEANHLRLFLRDFNHSDFITSMKAADTSITKVDIAISLHRRFNPILNSAVSYNIDFHERVYHPVDGMPVPVVSSTGFYIPSSAKIHYFDDDGYGNIRVYYISGSDRIVVYPTQGTIDYASGLVSLTRFAPSAIVGDEIKLFVKPNNNNVTPARNHILVFSDTRLKVFSKVSGALLQTGVVDTIGTATSFYERGFAT